MTTATSFVRAPESLMRLHMMRHNPVKNFLSIVSYVHFIVNKELAQMM